MSGVKRDRALSQAGKMPSYWYHRSSPYRTSDTQGYYPPPTSPPQSPCLKNSLSPRRKWSVERHAFLLPRTVGTEHPSRRAMSSLILSSFPTAQLSFLLPQIRTPLSDSPHSSRGGLPCASHCQCACPGLSQILDDLKEGVARPSRAEDVSEDSLLPSK